MLSVDGVGAFDLISRAAMLEGTAGLQKVAMQPFHLFLNSTALLRRVFGRTTLGGPHEIIQGERRAR